MVRIHDSRRRTARTSSDLRKLQHKDPMKHDAAKVILQTATTFINVATSSASKRLQAHFSQRCPQTITILLQPRYKSVSGGLRLHMKRAREICADQVADTLR